MPRRPGGHVRQALPTEAHGPLTCFRCFDLRPSAETGRRSGTTTEAGRSIRDTDHQFARPTSSDCSGIPERRLPGFCPSVCLMPVVRCLTDRWSALGRVIISNRQPSSERCSLRGCEGRRGRNRTAGRGVPASLTGGYLVPVRGPGNWLRRTRAGLLGASACLLLGAAGHMAAGGRLPGATGLAGLFAVLTVVCGALSALRRHRFAAIVVALGLAQSLLHLVFHAMAGGHGGAPVPHTMNSALMEHAGLARHHGMPVGSGASEHSTDLGMALAHTLAALGAAVCLIRGERVLGRLSGLLLRPLLRAFVAATVPSLPQRPGTEPDSILPAPHGPCSHAPVPGAVLPGRRTPDRHPAPPGGPSRASGASARPVRFTSSSLEHTHAFHHRNDQTERPLRHVRDGACGPAPSGRARPARPAPLLRRGGSSPRSCSSPP